MQNPVLILGASGEIGTNIARKFSQNGHSLILHGNNNAPPKIRSFTDSQTIESICADLTDKKSVQTLFVVSVVQHANRASNKTLNLLFQLEYIFVCKR